MAYRGFRNKLRFPFAGWIPQSPGFMDPGLWNWQNPVGQRVGNELSMMYGAGTPVASYNIAMGRVPHVQTSPGVYESAYRVAGMPDPRFDQEAILNSLLGQGGSSNAAASPQLQAQQMMRNIQIAQQRAAEQQAQQQQQNQTQQNGTPVSNGNVRTASTYTLHG